MGKTSVDTLGLPTGDDDHSSARAISIPLIALAKFLGTIQRRHFIKGKAVSPTRTIHIEATDDDSYEAWEED